ncbi:MAG: helix-hairpin-helix domain-containing protein [Clostridiales bacterium]|nr:helix-hairpin-helix domain-containing protein [Clostridiales bacterium]
MKEIIRKQRKLLLVIICMLAAGICYSCGGGPFEDGKTVIRLDGGEAAGQEAGTAEVPESGAEAPGTEAEASGGGTEAPRGGAEAAGGDDLSDEPAETLIYVHVCGMVQEPGVYAIPEGSRIYDAVQAAGGFQENGSRDFLNLAQQAVDGMKIEVPDKAQAERWKKEGTGTGISMAGGSAVSSEGAFSQNHVSASKVDINRSSKEALMTLKGIGESRAEDIIRYREEFGSFQTIEDIMNVPGIKEGAFNKIRDQITV